MCVLMCEVRGCPGQVRVQWIAYFAGKCRLPDCRFDTGSDRVVGKWRPGITKVPKNRNEHRRCEMENSQFARAPGQGARWEFPSSHHISGASWEIPISHRCELGNSHLAPCPGARANWEFSISPRRAHFAFSTLSPLTAPTRPINPTPAHTHPIPHPYEHRSDPVSRR